MKIENLKVYDLEESIKASKYPMAIDTESCTSEITKTVISLGNSQRGSGHDNYLHGIRVSFDLTFTNKAWVEFERYNFADIVSSQSTMHRITKLNIRQQCNKYVWNSTIVNIEKAVKEYNHLSEIYQNMNYDLNAKKEDICSIRQQLIEKYLEILYNIPSGFELTARISTNYGQLKTMYNQRYNHRLPEWREFCQYMKNNLPKFKELCLKKSEKNKENTPK